MLNKAMIIGRLGDDPELRKTNSGKSVCNMSVATNRTWKDDNGQKQEDTEWHRIVVFGRQADNCEQYLSKGRQVYIEGRIQTREWTDNDGNKRYSTEIVAQSVQFLSGGDQNGRSKQSGGGRSNNRGRRNNNRGRRNNRNNNRNSNNSNGGVNL